MADERLANLARILVHYSAEVRPGQWVLLSGNTLALPLIGEAARQILQAGARFDLLLDSDEIKEIVLAESDCERLSWLSPAETLLFERVDAIVHVAAASNTRCLTDAAPEKQQWLQAARARLYANRSRRAAEGSLRWVYTEFPCPAYAQDADLSLRAYEDFAYAAALADQPDPVERCQEAYRRDDQRAAWLTGHRDVHVRGANVDLRLSIAGRTFLNSAGRNNVPDGEVYTGPVEDSVNGWVHFTYPAIFNGREVEGVELEFRDGQVVRAGARKNEAYLRQILAADAGARYLGEFAIGTNERIQRFTRRILYDEKIGGTFHIAIGQGYPGTGSRNQSAMHWDFIGDLRPDGEVLVDGECVCRDGTLLI
jgi:aminopeptidase